MLPLMPRDAAYETLDFGLHKVPQKLKMSLQERIDQSGGDYDILVLGYALCSLAVVGLHSQHCTLVIPKVDDCIALFLGSAQAYQDQARQELGTYYLTKGWIAADDTVLGQRTRLTQKYGSENAEYILHEMLKHYKRLAYIDTGTYNREPYLSQARSAAEELELRFETVQGSNQFVYRTIYGPWGSDFVVAPPGHTLTYQDFQDF